jgi:hypothetical protein
LLLEVDDAASTAVATIGGRHHTIEAGGGKQADRAPILAFDRIISRKLMSKGNFVRLAQ